LLESRNMGRTNTRATGLVFRNNQIMLIHRFKHGAEYWTVPGGGVEDGETVEEALAREMHEELGVTLLSFKKVFDFVPPDHPGNIAQFFICEIGDQTPKLGDGPESQSHSPENQYLPTWVDLDQLPHLVLYPSAAKEVIQAYADHQKLL
jgi:ADP-ribose pyrophosphatase YjhB (NUDIX family)